MSLLDTLPALASDLFHALESIAERLGCDIEITTREDDPDQPEAFGVWFVDADENGDPEHDLVGAGSTINHALSDALDTVRSWS